MAALEHDDLEMARLRKAGEPVTAAPVAEERIAWVAGDGKERVMCLTAANADRFREVIAEWRDASRVVAPVRLEHRSGPLNGTVPAATGGAAPDIRQWAALMGKPMAARGAPTKGLKAEYEAYLTQRAESA